MEFAKFHRFLPQADLNKAYRELCCLGIQKLLLWPVYCKNYGHKSGRQNYSVTAFLGESAISPVKTASQSGLMEIL